VIVLCLTNNSVSKQQEEENDALNVRLSTLDKELERTQSELEVVNSRLETAAKQASDVSF
jgi:chaperonin cofactor prefoldin